MEIPLLVRTNHLVRASAFAYCFVAIGLHLWGQSPAPFVWLLFALQFLVYPHLLYWRARRSARPTRAELDNLYIDAALLGLWSAYLGFPTWITYALLAGTTLNATVNRGLRGTFISLGCSAAGAALFVATGDFTYRPATSGLVSAVFFLGVLGYTCAVGTVVYRQHRRIGRARDELRASEERYRLIGENVADLVAMVDHNGRWLYTSPSHARVLDAPDLAHGADAFARLHPDDADAARAAVAHAAATGKSREVAPRLVDRDGRIRQYKTRIQPLKAQAAGSAAPCERFLLVSQDVTDLRESEEKLLLAADALEGMTEAILISGADGTVQTVNAAFCSITGFSRADVLGQSLKDIRTALQPAEFYDEVYAIVHREGYWSGTHWSRRRNGSVYREWRSIRAVRNAAGATTHYVMLFYEVGAKDRGLITKALSP